MKSSNILALYRSQEPIKELIHKSLLNLQEIVPCQACSLFIFDEYDGCLKFLSGTNIKEPLEIPSFHKDTAIWKMFESKDAGRIDFNQIKEHFPTTDIFFENVALVSSISFCPLFDEKDRKIGVIRLLNKQTQERQISDFLQEDLVSLRDFCQVIGALITVSTLRTKYESFLDSVTHELLAPISGIKNTASHLNKLVEHPHLIEAKALNTKIQKFILDILHFSSNAITLVQGLTMFTKSGRMSLSDLDLKISNLDRDIIRKTISNLFALISSRKFNPKSINMSKWDKWPLLEIDRKVFIQVFNNLLSNAIKYAHEDPQAFAVNIELEALRDGNALIVIKDYGIGLRKDEVPNIFEPGFRGKDARSKITTGTGIGLTTVRNLLNAHGCKIEVTNLQNPTEFSITIPIKFVVRRKDDYFHRR